MAVQLVIQVVGLPDENWDCTTVNLDSPQLMMVLGESGPSKTTIHATKTRVVLCPGLPTNLPFEIIAGPKH